MKQNQWVKDMRDPEDENFRGLRSIRYADDYRIGFTGKKEEASEIKTMVENYLEVKLTVNREKSGIYHFSDRVIQFLGFYVRYIPTPKIVNQSGEENLNEGVMEERRGTKKSFHQQCTAPNTNKSFIGMNHREWLCEI